jgi:hypothetical protein
VLIIKAFDRRKGEDSRNYWFLAVRYALILEHISGPKKKQIHKSWTKTNNNAEGKFRKTYRKVIQSVPGSVQLMKC